MPDSESFAEIEKAFIRKKILPEFDWISFNQPSVLNEPGKELSKCRIALVSTAGAHLANQPPFNVRDKHGDDSYREIPAETPANELVLSHHGYNTPKISEDPNCVFPIDRLRELADEGVIGALNQRAFSFMGYVPFPESLMQVQAPEVASKLKDDGVDLVVLVPS